VRRLGALAVLAVGVLAACRARAEDTAAIAVVVGQKSFVTQVSVDDLRELYLRRRRLWSGGQRAIPINLPPIILSASGSRRRSSAARPATSSRTGTRYFEGITPPAVLPSPAAIRAYLAAEPAAIGYVPVSEVDDTCRTLLVLGR
jgi:hypothetical protein